MQLKDMKMVNYSKTKRIHMTRDTYERFQYIARMSDLNNDAMLNQLMDTWENTIYNAEPLYNYDKMVSNFNAKTDELKTVFETSIRDSYKRYDKLVDKYHELQAKEQLNTLQKILNKELETK